MTELAQSLNIESMEDVIQLWEFGKWARNFGDVPRLSVPSWVFEIKTADREGTLKRYIGDIDESYAIELDGEISDLPERNKNVIYLYYVRMQPWRSVARSLKSTVYTVRNDRDIAVSLLYGRLKSA